MKEVFNSHPMILEYNKEIKNFVKTRENTIENLVLVKELNVLKGTSEKLSNF
jgi:hypothetical protein